MASVEILLSYIFVICLICSYCLFFGHLFVLCCSSIFCLNCLDESSIKLSEDNIYKNLRKDTRDCVISIEEHEQFPKVICKTNSQASNGDFL